MPHISRANFLRRKTSQSYAIRRTFQVALLKNLIENHKFSYLSSFKAGYQSRV